MLVLADMIETRVPNTVQGPYLQSCGCDIGSDASGGSDYGGNGSSIVDEIMGSTSQIRCSKDAAQFFKLLFNEARLL